MTAANAPGIMISGETSYEPLTALKARGRKKIVTKASSFNAVPFIFFLVYATTMIAVHTVQSQTATAPTDQPQTAAAALMAQHRPHSPGPLGHRKAAAVPARGIRMGVVAPEENAVVRVLGDFLPVHHALLELGVSYLWAIGEIRRDVRRLEKAQSD
ncbi:hypothetical protein V496_08665 [Pseudogymnoascus sp. VKM F-4515 (FW-2607)]|nr:hypothetical protein V496_08665 [Pseudogymnoascus sp. VKM F-4515 (FW-2607)]